MSPQTAQSESGPAESAVAEPAAAADSPAGVVYLTPETRRRGKRLYYIHSSFNAISWAALAEGVVVLLILKLGATEIWVGAISSLIYATMPFMLMGYRTIPRMGVTGTAAFFWMTRSVSAGFILIAPWLAVHFTPLVALWSVFLGSLGFSLGRAGGMVAFTGIITELTTSQDRGDMIANSSKLSQVVTILMTVAVAGFLGEAAPLDRYQIFILIGIVTGLASAYSLWRIPESGRFKATVPFSLRRELKWLLGSSGNRWFFAMMLFVPLTQGITRIFVILVAKRGYGLSDQEAMLFVLLGIVGGITASFTYGLFLDRVGSRPLMFITGFLEIASALLVVLLPAQHSLLLLGLIFFLNGYAQVALEAALQHYFISITTTERQLPQGIVTRGLGGLIGGLALYLGGASLEGLRAVLGPEADSMLPFRWFYGAVLVVLVLRTLVFYYIPRLNSQGIRNSLNALFSPWDWRALYAVKRAVEIQSEDQETRALNAMMSAHAGIYSEDLDRYLRAPSFFVRQRAMDGLMLVKPTPELVAILMEDVKVNQFTTARHSAYWLGRWQVRSAVDGLVEALQSQDFLLQGSALHALVELDAKETLPQIRDLFTLTDNPYILIEGARALSLWGGRGEYALLLSKYHLEIPPQTKDEISLAIARLMGVYDAFYRDLGMLHREQETLFQEWTARFGPQDEQGLVTALKVGAPKRSLLERTLQQRQDQFQDWFVADTAAFLKRRPEWVFPQMALLMTFLLLSPRGHHRQAVWPVMV